MKRFAAAWLIIAGVACYAIYFFYPNLQNAGHKNLLPIIRLHIIANSNDAADQAVKYKIRDAIIVYLTPKLKNVRNLDEARKLIDAEQGNFRLIAGNILRKYNKYYQVSTIHGYSQFPPRNYGALFLPAGEYEALKIILGNGKGRNWWCVLFPPLCFVKESGVDIQKLTAQSINEEPNIKVRSKIWELLRGK